MEQLIALGSLAVAAISLIVGFVQRSKKETARDQRVMDKLDSLGECMRGIQGSVERLDGKIDDHSARITRLESEMDNAYRRISRIEGRCERHFGPSQHDA